MSTLQVTTISSANGTTDLTLKTGNTTGAAIIVSANGSGIIFNSNSTNTAMTVNTSGWYIGNTALQGSYVRQAFTGTGSCTAFTVTGGYTPNYIDVYVNGVRQEAAEITISSGSTVNFTTAPLNGSVIEVSGLKAGIPTLITPNTNLAYSWSNVHTFSNTITYGNNSVNAVVNSTALVIQGNTTSNVVVSNGAIRINGRGLSVDQGMKNRIINGDMRIYQRAAAISSNSTVQYSVDRWAANGIDAKGVINVSQSTTVYPNNFIASLHANVTTASASLAPGDYYQLLQAIEGVNIADLGWGTSAAETVTLSFWVYSTITGTYCASIRNSAADRSYVAEYSIPVANTWTQVAVTIPGDTTGTWNSNTSIGMRVHFSLGAGSTYQTTANAWTAGNYTATSSQVNFMAAGGNKFYLTGVQLEVAPIASPFEFRHYTTELALCQRYYEVLSVGTGGLGTERIIGGYLSGGAGGCIWPFKVTKRVNPTANLYTGSSAVSYTSQDMVMIQSSATYALIYSGSTATAEL